MIRSRRYTNKKCILAGCQASLGSQSTEGKAAITPLVRHRAVVHRAVVHHLHSWAHFAYPFFGDLG
jgi:hypothetical protein